MRVLVMGLGQYPQGSGVIVTEYLAKQGHDVTVVEPYFTEAMQANRARVEAYKNVTCITGQRGTAYVKRVDMVVRHQRMRIDEPEMVEAMRLHKPIETELSLFLKACPAPVIGVTGTRGKSTTTTLIYELASAGLKQRVWLGGNILLSPLTFLHRVKKTHLVVLEMSSFQLEGTGAAGISPQIAVWTNLMRDHLNTYPSMKEYAEAKAQVFRHQQSEDMAFLPSNSAFTAYAKSAPGHVYRFGKQGSEEAKIVASTKTALHGDHNIRNMETAVAVARYVGVSIPVIKRVLKTFAGLPGREEILRVWNGVTIVNDTTATTPDGTLAALKRFSGKGNVHLIFGGADKGLEFISSARVIKRLKPIVWLLPGSAHEKITAAWSAARVPWVEVGDLKDALTQIRALVQRGDTVLLSPGCASFGQFNNEFHRGDVFKQLVKRLFR